MPGHVVDVASLLLGLVDAVVVVAVGLGAVVHPLNAAGLPYVLALNVHLARVGCFLLLVLPLLELDGLFDLLLLFFDLKFGGLVLLEDLGLSNINILLDLGLELVVFVAVLVLSLLHGLIILLLCYELFVFEPLHLSHELGLALGFSNAPVGLFFFFLELDKASVH